MVKMVKKYLLCMLSVVTSLFLSVPAFAVTPWDDLVTAADVAGLSTSVLSILVLLVGLTILFTAYRFIRRALSGR
jgi:hypothetical protein